MTISQSPIFEHHSCIRSLLSQYPEHRLWDLFLASTQTEKLYDTLGTRSPRDFLALDFSPWLAVTGGDVLGPGASF